MSNDPTARTSTPAQTINPYASPTSDTAVAVPVASELEEYRRKYLNHEASVKSIGFLYGLAALFSIPLGLFMIGATVYTAAQGASINETLIVFLFSAVYTGFGILNAYAAIGLRRLTNGGRIAGIVMSVFGLLGFPIGTLISAYFLYLLASEKGKIVCSEAYRQVIAQTPHIKYKTSVVVWILFGILMFFIVLAMTAPLLA